MGYILKGIKVTESQISDVILSVSSDQMTALTWQWSVFMCNYKYT